MALSLADITFRKSSVVNNLDSNGDRLSADEVVSGAKHSIFPRVTKAERLAGVTRYRKLFLKNSNSDDLPASGVLVWMETPSNADDRFYMAAGTLDDIQSEMLAGTETNGLPHWLGVGALDTALAGGETSVDLLMENNDFEFVPGSTLHITDKVRASQTMASDVVTGDTVLWSVANSQWERQTASSNVTYPYGLYLGSNKVLTIEPDTHEEWLLIAENLYENEVIGTGDGTSAPELSDLAHATNGICKVLGLLPVIQATSSADATLTCLLDETGAVIATSDGISGQLNLTTGVWTTDITWDTTIKAGTDITITYRENPYSYVGNVATVELDEQVASTYATANSFAGSCISIEELVSAITDFAESSVGDGTFDNTTYPIVAHNEGDWDDDITLTFTSSTAFSVSGTNVGVIGTGSTLADFNAVDPVTSNPLFSIDHLGWSGTWQAGDTVTFTLVSAALPFWLKEVVPAATAEEPHNLATLGYYFE